MAIDLKLYKKIHYQIMCDISRVWYYRKLVNASLLHEEGSSINEIAEIFNVKVSTAKKYIEKHDELMESDDSETQYKLYIALATPNKEYDHETFDEILKYVYTFKIHEEDWFFKC
ncbi:TPA: helix-turn-helix domain-containing protein [Klebsiella pneumoniae]